MSPTRLLITRIALATAGETQMAIDTRCRSRFPQVASIGRLVLLLAANGSWIENAGAAKKRTPGPQRISRRCGMARSLEVFT